MKLMSKSFFDELFSPFNYNINQYGYLKTDISKRNNNYVFDIDVPGYLKEDIKISVENNYLTVKVVGSKTTTHCTTCECEVLHQERYNGEYERSYYVGNVKNKEINATYHNGVLTIVIPIDEKENDKKTKYIDIM